LVETNRFIKYPKGVVRKICRIRLGAELSGRRCSAAAGRPLGAPARVDLWAGAATGRMRVRDGRAGGSGGPPGCAFNARRNDGPASSRGMYARGPVHDHQPERFRCRSVL